MHMLARKTITSLQISSFSKPKPQCNIHELSRHNQCIPHRGFAIASHTHHTQAAHPPFPSLRHPPPIIPTNSVLSSLVLPPLHAVELSAPHTTTIQIHPTTALRASFWAHSTTNSKTWRPRLGYTSPPNNRSRSKWSWGSTFWTNCNKQECD